MRYLIVMLLLFSGCSFKAERFHYVSVDRCTPNAWHNRGVYTVELPSYFIDDRFVYKSGDKLGYLDERFARDPQKFLSECAVRELGACLYPWECEKRPKTLYYIKLDEFFYDKNRNLVILVANVNHKLYSVEEQVRKDVIDTALQAYKRLLAQIGK